MEDRNLGIRDGGSDAPAVTPGLYAPWTAVSVLRALPPVLATGPNTGHRVSELMQPGSPTVSILLSVHNGERYLSQAIESLMVQSYAAWELIAVNDGSTDRTAEILMGLAAQDLRIRIIARPNQGLTRSLNEAAALARGHYLARMDADDASLPDRLALQIRHLDSHPRCLALGGQAFFIDSEGALLGVWHVPQEHHAIDQQHLSGFGGGIIHPAVMLRKDAFLQVGGYDITLPAAQDYDLWLRLAEQGELANLKEYVLHYRLHLSSITSSRRRLQAECLRDSCARARERRGLSGIPRHLRRRYPVLSPCRQRLQWVRVALKSGFPEAAFKHARLACRAAPLRPDAWLHLLAAGLLARLGWRRQLRSHSEPMEGQPHGG
jgi:GT2 family glycosyltransferase